MRYEWQARARGQHPRPEQRAHQEGGTESWIPAPERVESQPRQHRRGQRDQDGELVCSDRGPTTTYTLKPKWTRLAIDMVFPEGKEVPHGTYFKAKHLLEKDGACTLTMKIDDKPYGVWKFEVEGGKPKHLGRAARGSANPLTFIDGGRDAFWYAKEKN